MACATAARLRWNEAGFSGRRAKIIVTLAAKTDSCHGVI
jgi:hypothetical protein